MNDVATIQPEILQKLDPQQNNGSKRLESVLAKYPGLTNVFNLDNSVVSMADEKRQALNQSHGGGGSIETWPPKETGAPGSGFYHPSPGKYNFEFFNEDLYNDPTHSESTLYLDMIHGMKQDPEFKKLRDEFNSNWKPSEKEWTKEMFKKEGMEGETYDEYMDRTLIDGYLRGGLNDMSDEDINNPKAVLEYAQAYRGLIKNKDGSVANPYSDKQRQIIDKMKTYLKQKPGQVKEESNGFDWMKYIFDNDK
jgi:hypothetical protein